MTTDGIVYTGELRVNLLVPDVVSSVEFYERVFGFTFQGYWDPAARRSVPAWAGPGQPEYAEVGAGNARIGLRPGGSPAPSRAPEFALHVLSAEATAKRIREAHGNPTTPALQPWGATMFSATDLNGYRWHFTEIVEPKR
jgi:predicted enzyme related to lactoylglutathione lyase